MSDIIELKGKIEEVAKALHDERQVYDELKAEQAKGRISEAELKSKIEKLEKLTDRVEDQKAALEKMQATIQRIGNGAEESSEGKIDTKAMSQAIKSLLRSNTKFDKQALASLSDVERKALSNSINEDGGFRVMADRDSELGRIVYDTSNLRAVARVISIGSNRFEKVSKDTTSGAVWGSEIATRAATDTAQTFLSEYPVHEIYSWQDVTEQHIEDASYDVLGETAEDAAIEIGLEQNAAFITGNGVGKPRGISTYATKTASPSVYARGQVGTILAASATTVTFDELMAVQDALKVPYLPNASWLLSRASRSVVRKLKYTSGTNEYIWEMSTQVGVPSNMLGNPVQIMEDMPAMATGAISIIFGDIRRAYTIADRIGMSVLDDPYTAAPYRRLKYRARVAAGLVSYDAIKYLKQA